jgi:hypothetical protein
LGDELNKFSAVRRDEMASRSSQVLGLLDSCVCLVYYLYCICLDRFPDFIGGRNRLQVLKGQDKPRSFTSQSITFSA